MEFDVLIFAVITTGVVLVVTQFVRLVRTSILHRTIRKAINNDSAAVPALLAGVQEKPAANGDTRSGIILIALGVAIFLFGVIQGDAEDIRNMASISVFPLLVGAVLVAHHRYAKRRESSHSGS